MTDMAKRPMDGKTLRYYARMAAEAYMNDPVHAYATKTRPCAENTCIIL